MSIYSENDELLFWTLTSDQRKESWPSLAEGPVRLRMVLPQRLLNEGAYRIELLASLHFRTWLLEPRGNAPSVNFSIQGGLSDSPFWHSKRPGLLAPVLSWQNF